MGNKPLKGPGGSLGSVRKSLGQSAGEERPLDVAGEGAKAELREGQAVRPLDAAGKGTISL